MALFVAPGCEIPERELEERFIRSPGPGGQNVNKVATAVQLRFDAAHSSAVPAPVFARLRRLAGSRMSADGVVSIEAHRFRAQARNRDDARARLADLLRRAAQPPKRRIATAPTAASRERRLRNKRVRSERKRARSKSELD